MLLLLVVLLVVLRSQTRACHLSIHLSYPYRWIRLYYERDGGGSERVNRVNNKVGYGVGRVGLYIIAAGQVKARLVPHPHDHRLCLELVFLCTFVQPIRYFLYIFVETASFTSFPI